MALHAVEGKTPFSEDTRARTALLKQVYDLDLVAADSHLTIGGGEALRPSAIQQPYSQSART